VEGLAGLRLGSLGDMDCHILDPAFWALELGPPKTIEATSTTFEPDFAEQTFSRASIVRYSFPRAGGARRSSSPGTTGVLDWDSPNLRFTNNERANALLHIAYREGWSL
jgi:hypothetical protein